MSKSKKDKRQPKEQSKNSGCQRFLRNILLTLFMFAVMTTAAISYGVDLLYLKPRKSSEITEETYLYMYGEYPFLRRWTDSLKRHNKIKDTYILSADSVRLHAFYMEAPFPTPKTAVILHDRNQNAVRMLHIAYLYNHDLHFNVLLPELRGHGLSEGQETGFGWVDRLDLLKWTAQADSIFGGGTRMVVHGVGAGAATAVMASGEKQPHYMRAYVEDCGYTSAWDEISHLTQRDYSLPEMPFVELASLFCQWQYGWNFKEASCIDQVKKASLPILFIHSGADNEVPTSMVYELYQSKHNNKDIWTAPRVLHSKAYHDRKDEYTQRVDAFVNMFVNDK